MKRVGKLRAQDKAFAEGAYKVAPAVASKAAPAKVGKLAAAKAVLKSKPGKLGMALAAVAVGQEAYKESKRPKKKDK
jgi:hypothetical protein